MIRETDRDQNDDFQNYQKKKDNANLWDTAERQLKELLVLPLVER